MDAYLGQFAEPEGYLDFARFGPVSAAVSERMALSARMVHSEGGRGLATLEGLHVPSRAAAARLLAAEEHEVAFVGSTSHGLFAAAQALSRRSGVILVPRNDFPSNVYPWLRAAERGGLQVRWMDGPVTPDSIRPLLDDTVKAVAVSAVDSFTGALAPLAAIKELIGSQRVLVVDAVQAFGAVEFDVDAADVLASGGQKWLRAGWGAAALLVRDRVADMLEPGLGGWSGVQNPLNGEPHPHEPLRGAAAHTLTNPDPAAVAAYGVAAGLVLQVGLRQIHGRITETLAALLDAAAGQGAQLRYPRPGGGIGSFTMPGADPVALNAALAQAGVTTTMRDGWHRLAPHASTDAQIADALAGVLARHAHAA